MPPETASESDFDADPASSSAESGLRLALSRDPNWPTQSDAIVNAALTAAFPAAAETGDGALWEVSVALTSDDEVQALNKTWRGKDNPTNVLSFPADMPDLPPAQ